MRKKRGMIFIVAMLAMLGMVLIGTAFVSSASQQLKDARRDLDMLHSTALADAGLNYFIWQQRYSDSPITTIYEPFSDIYNLTPNGDPAPQITSDILSFDEAVGHVWLFEYDALGASQISYQVVAKGYCRDRTRTVRAVLQGPVSLADPPRPPWMDYAIFADASMVIDTSSNIHGNLASNGNIILNTSAGGGLVGNVHAATTVKIGKNSTFVAGNLAYGTTVYDKNNQILTDAQAKVYFSGSVAPIPANQPKTMQIDGMNPQLYFQWAQSYGNAAFYNDTTLSNPALLTTPILYVNSENTPNFNLRILANLPGPRTIFINGNLELRGNITLGSAANPIAVIATGNIISNGNPIVNGMIWANGTFGGGTPRVNGTVRCQVLGTFQGNPQIYWQQYSDQFIVPPDFTDLWKQGSWELL